MTLVIDNVENEGLSDFRSFRSQALTTTLSASTLLLTAASQYYQLLIGSTTGQIVQLPDATTLQVGHTFWVWNGGTATLTLRNQGATQVYTMNPNSRVNAVLRDNSTAAGIWLISATSGSLFSGVSGILGSYNGNANVGRYLEFFPGIDSLTAPYFIPVNSYIVAFTLSAIANSTGTVGIFKTSNLVTPLTTLSLTANKNVFNITLGVPLNQGDFIAARVTSGSINKPYIVWYITGG